MNSLRGGILLYFFTLDHFSIVILFHIFLFVFSQVFEQGLFLIFLRKLWTNL